MRTWSTDIEPPHRQFSYWREVLCEAFVALDPVRKESSSGFTGHVRSRTLGDTMQTEIVSRPQHINRRQEEIRRNPVEYYFCNFQLAGACVVRQDGHDCLVPSGSFSLVDSTRPYFLDFRDDWRVLSFRIPKAHLAPKLASPRQGLARCIDGTSGPGLIATDFARSLMRCEKRLDSAAEDGLGSALSSIVAAALGSAVAPEQPMEPGLRSATLSAIERYISESLANPALSPETIAGRFRLSRRALYSLFEDAPESISGTIRSLRLERSAQDLAQPHGPTILEVALRWGFNDSSHFSRLFKRRFGVCPREFRAAAVQGA